jgi:LacI family transcriptional regulator
MAVTSKDIAAKLGISQPTVSRILSGNKEYKVAPSTRTLIISTAEAMGYRANALARALRNKHTNVVGLYANPQSIDTRQDFFAYAYAGLQRAFGAHCVDVLVHQPGDDRLPSDVYGELVDGRTDGVVVYISPESSLVPYLQKSTRPIVAIGDPIVGVPSVGSDDAGGMMKMMEHLWVKGHRSFAYLADDKSAAVARRSAAYQQFLVQRDVEPDRRIKTFFDTDRPDVMVDHLMGLSPRPTAVCCSNDRIAYALLRYCMSHAIRVPDDIAVVGFDGVLDTKLPILDLTTVRVPWYEIAQAAVDILMDRIVGKDVPAQTLLPAELVPGTTG